MITVRTNIKAGKNEDPYGPVQEDGTKCRHMETRGLCVDCCIDRNGAEFANACQAGCGRFYPGEV